MEPEGSKESTTLNLSIPIQVNYSRFMCDFTYFLNCPAPTEYPMEPDGSKGSTTLNLTISIWVN